ncbi:MAG TPA: hypothetical protein VHX18_12965 [Rhizomicrobium sp.]|jgi:hypothetical protein|nr:hypothetical protein [Rhizomicrobium sp.]
MADFPTSTIRITAIELQGEDKVRITVEVLVDVHRMVEVGGKMLSIAAKGAAKKKK